MEPEKSSGAGPIMTKTLLIVSGSGEAAEVARRVREMGHTVVVSDADPQAPAFAFADSCLIADVHGAQETAAAAERYNRKIRKIDGVLCVADAPLTAATVADRLRLPGLPLHVAELAADRLMIRRSFGSAGVAAPWHAPVSTPQELQRIVIAKGRGLVLKPVDNRGPDGVQQLAQTEDLNAAFLAARAHSADERVMVEQEPEGTRSSVASLMLGGICHMAGTPDKQVADPVGRAAAALGISDGLMVSEIVMHQGAVQVTDISARLAGPFLDAAIALALGETPHNPRP
jgi:biotin carboxylase